MKLFFLLLLICVQASVAFVPPTLLAGTVVKDPKIIASDVIDWVAAGFNFDDKKNQKQQILSNNADWFDMASKEFQPPAIQQSKQESNLGSGDWFFQKIQSGKIPDTTPRSLPSVQLDKSDYHWFVTAETPISPPQANSVSNYGGLAEWFSIAKPTPIPLALHKTESLEDSKTDYHWFATTIPPKPSVQVPVDHSDWFADVVVPSIPRGWTTSSPASSSVENRHSEWFTDAIPESLPTKKADNTVLEGTHEWFSEEVLNPEMTP